MDMFHSLKGGVIRDIRSKIRLEGSHQSLGVTSFCIE